MPIPYRIQPGDCLLGLAAQYLYEDWKAIWNLRENQELREKRKDPTVLAPGDLIFLPDPKPQTHQLETGKKHRVVVRPPKVQVRPQVLHMDATAIAGCAYKLTPGAHAMEGQTDNDGFFEQRVPPLAKKLTLTVQLTGDPQGPCYRWMACIGHLDPIDTPSGLRQRLSNLGYWPTVETSQAALPYVLRAFQADHDIKVTGEADPTTLDKIRETHGGI
jgi:hypothetical protein